MSMSIIFIFLEVTFGHCNLRIECFGKFRKIGLLKTSLELSQKHPKHLLADHPGFGGRPSIILLDGTGD